MEGESKFLDICSTNGNELIKYYNILFLFFCIVVLSKSTDYILRGIFTIIFIIIIMQYWIPIAYDLGKKYSEEDKARMNIGLYLVSAISCILSFVLINSLNHSISIDEKDYSYLFPTKLIAWNAVVFIFPAIVAVFNSTKKSIDLTSIIKTTPS